MKKSKYIIALFATIFLLGCQDILDKSPHNTVSSENFWKNSTDALQGLTACYATFYNQYLSSAQSESGNRVYWGDGYTDNMFENVFGATYFTTGQHGPTFAGMFTGYYKVCYNVITNVNMFLAKVEGVTMDEPTRSKYKAEAMFLRAFVYHDLALFYGDVPLFTKEPTLEDATVGRSPASEVMKLVHADLDYAIQNLPDVSYYDGHVVKNSALALKARVCLFSKDWAGAAQYAGLVMASGKTNLYANYQKMFWDGQASDNKEILFSVRFKFPDISHGMSFVFQSYPANNVLEDLVNDYYTINGLPITKDPIYDPKALWLNRDPRLQMSIFCQPGEVFPPDIKGYSYYWQGSYTKFRIKKNTSPTVLVSSTNDDHDFIHIRYGDVLLMYAEAKNELGQFVEDDWNKTIKLLRTRVGFTKVSALQFPGGTQSDLRTEIRHERRIELALEAMRYYDLQRWNTMSEEFANIAGENPQKKVFNATKGYLWPIPQNSIDYYKSNNVLFPQNPGY